MGEREGPSAAPAGNPSGSGSAEGTQGHGWTAVVDRTLCVGFAECVKVAPTVFQLDDETIAVVIDPEAVDLEMLRAAACACPVDAITLYDADGRQIWPQT